MRNPLKYDLTYASYTRFTYVTDSQRKIEKSQSTVIQCKFIQN
jgi:hypothetical protein